MNPKMNSIRLTAGACVLLAGLVPVAQAQTIGEVVKRQNDLARMDHTIERNERLLEIQEQSNELTMLMSPEPEPEAEEGRMVQEQYFGQRPGGMNGMPQQPEKTPEQMRAERILMALDGATVSEVFLPPNAKDDKDFVAVIDMGDAAREVRLGSSIDGWAVTAVSLNRVTFRNKEFGETRTVYQAR